ncbi:MAG TPA: 2-amino-4-hydroxy-6-hydroxymethyldihydropteridine diphosphokinase [Candidatus Acidoferrales bacterium]|nr:2-amino-4-hydroxy-6-hydroxymethyldihydropteridine diphosphokinase [Candidatus Acidoferrales bacterium]
MKTAYVSLGSNVGDREQQIAAAIQALGARGVRVVRQSSIYSTEPVDVATQSWFLNCVLEIETDLMPRQLLRTFKEIENELGRKHTVRRGPRVIDLDILLYGSSVVETPDLQIPHPRMTLRRFVLVPLAEIAPALRHPVENKSVEELLAETEDRSIVHRCRAGALGAVGR